MALRDPIYIMGKGKKEEEKQSVGRKKGKPEEEKDAIWPTVLSEMTTLYSPK